MSVEVRPFGTLADGRPVRAARLAAGAIEFEVIEYGAHVRSLRAYGIETILRLDTLAEYEADDRYLGPIVGRCANRIASGRFTLDGQPVQVSANEHGNTLHGGKVGWNKRLWVIEGTDEDSVALSYRSPDGEEGFPGAVSASATYRIEAPDTLTITYEAAAEAATPVNLSQHLYFNLTGDPARTVLDHDLTIAAEAITSVDAALIPTGAIVSVTGTPFDFHRPRRIGEALTEPDPQTVLAEGFDHNFVLDDGPIALRLTSPETALTLALSTDQPGVQIYDGHGLTAPFIKHGALVIEPQGFPDAVNHPAFPSVILRPGETYRWTTRYAFSRPSPNGSSGAA